MGQDKFDLSKAAETAPATTESTAPKAEAVEVPPPNPEIAPDTPKPEAKV